MLITNSLSHFRTRKGNIVIMKSTKSVKSLLSLCRTEISKNNLYQKPMDNQRTLPRELLTYLNYEWIICLIEFSFRTLIKFYFKFKPSSPPSVSLFLSRMISFDFIWFPFMFAKKNPNFDSKFWWINVALTY